MYNPYHWITSLPRRNKDKQVMPGWYQLTCRLCGHTEMVDSSVKTLTVSFDQPEDVKARESNLEQQTCGRRKYCFKASDLDEVNRYAQYGYKLTQIVGNSGYEFFYMTYTHDS